MTINQFRLKKLMTDFVIINIILNGAFYLINFRKHTGTVTFGTISTDLMIGLTILAVACPAAGFLNIPKALNKSTLDVTNRKKSFFNRMFPKKNSMRSLVLTVFTLAFSFVFFLVLPNALGVNTINHYIGFSIKVITAIIMSGIVGYVVIELTMDDYQDKQITLLKESY
ncbi:hypothetical protein DOK76_01420 [Vagococcus sp. DIV0080]|uniref:Uncharacterized protein n=1 Tax=Candidatus Vagococcus giribetii TaxID=2230876 RepID=A0ABS3HPN7_9ENTE|nr:hypothetical protein [Vagococcus sp. DIV0080]MBO0475709.1 hypothetical protein [Vagococcus sp. DIV0080]